MSDIIGAIAHHCAVGILLVDDSAAIRRGLRREFEGAGWVVMAKLRVVARLSKRPNNFTRSSYYWTL
jgi:hypothetical protein